MADRWRGVLVAVGALAVQIGIAVPAGAAPGDLWLASTSDSGARGNGENGDFGYSALSADGMTVAFSSTTTNFGEGDTDTITDVYVKDLSTGALTLASTSDAGTKANAFSGEVSLSADGTKVAFRTTATNLGEGDTDAESDVYVKDLTTGALTLASTSDTGTKGNAFSHMPSLSDDGTKVAFASLADNFGEGNTNATRQVYVKDLTTGALTLASASSTGVAASSYPDDLDLSGDGTAVAFTSFGGNLGVGGLEFGQDAFVKDLITGAVTLASSSDTGVEGNGHTMAVALSADGTTAAFSTRASNLGEGDADAESDVYVKDLVTGALTLASTSDTGTKSDNYSGGAFLSADGSVVAFGSSASNLGEGYGHWAPGTYVKDLRTGALTLASTSDVGVKGDGHPVGLSADGRRVAIGTPNPIGEIDIADGSLDVYVKELPGPTTPTALPESYATLSDQPLAVPGPGVLANDVEVDAGDSLRAAVATWPSHGSVLLAPDGGFTYWPNQWYAGPDSFTYRASDGSNSSAPTTVTITVGNRAPSTQPDSFYTAEDTAVTIGGRGVLANDTDPENVALSAALVTGPAHGTLSLSAAGGFTYTPARDFAGTDGFTYLASDGSLSSGPVAVALWVGPVNDTPVASAGPDRTVAHEADATLAGTATDVDGDGLNYAWTQVGGPPAVIRDPDELKTVVEGVGGPATLRFRLTVTDPHGAVSTDEVTVTVNPK